MPAGVAERADVPGPISSSEPPTRATLTPRYRGGNQSQRERNRWPTEALGERGACEGAQRKTRDERRQCGGESVERGTNDESQHARPDHLVRESREACKRQHCCCKSVSTPLGVPTIDVCRGATGSRLRAIVPGILPLDARLGCPSSDSATVRSRRTKESASAMLPAPAAIPVSVVPVRPRIGMRKKPAASEPAAAPAVLAP